MMYPFDVSRGGGWLGLPGDIGASVVGEAGGVCASLSISGAERRS